MTQSVRGYREKVGGCEAAERAVPIVRADRQACPGLYKVTLRHGIDHEFPHVRQC